MRKTANKNTGIAEPIKIIVDVAISYSSPSRRAFFMPKGMAMR